MRLHAPLHWPDTAYAVNVYLICRPYNYVLGASNNWWHLLRNCWLINNGVLCCHQMLKQIRLQQRHFFYTGSQRSFSEEVRELELSWKRREDYLAVISQADIMDSVIKNGRICSDHFLTGKPAALIDNTSPNWLPTENLSHSIVSRKRVATCQERYQRKKAHSGWMNDQAQQTSQSKAGLIDGTCNES